jgi:diaminohydroxyphosphoribosylaminopyrimidine deaminase/5-amino-6-(5-phosphoribosylamino)uracil reductase
MITGDAVRNRVHLLRAQSDAIMIGSGTVLADDPVLTCRLPGMIKMSPTRVILDSTLRLPIRSRLVQTAHDTPLWVITAEHAPPASEAALRGHGADVVRTVEKNGLLDLMPVLKLLAARGVTRLMVEGGPTLASAFIAADLVDEALLFHSPTRIGDDGLAALDPRARTMLDQHLKRISSEQVGPDRQEYYERESLADV